MESSKRISLGWNKFTFRRSVTHYNVDYRIGSTRVLTNQRGYPHEVCDGFDPGMVIEV